MPRPPPRVPSVRRLPFVGDARPSLRSVRPTPPRLPSPCRPARPSVVGSLPRPSLRSGRCAPLRPSGGAPLARYYGWVRHGLRPCLICFVDSQRGCFPDALRLSPRLSVVRAVLSQRRKRPPPRFRLLQNSNIQIIPTLHFRQA